MEIGPNLLDLLGSIAALVFFGFLVWRVTR
jgi:hypothetical protein